MSVMYESKRVAITFQLLEISSIAHPTRNNFEYLHKVHFSRVFLGKISAILPICIMKKIQSGSYV